MLCLDFATFREHMRGASEQRVPWAACRFSAECAAARLRVSYGISQLSCISWHVHALPVPGREQARTHASQGILGSIPWTALVFLTLYLQLIGMSDLHAGALMALFLGGTALGSLLGAPPHPCAPPHHPPAPPQALLCQGLHDQRGHVGLVIM